MARIERIFRLRKMISNDLEGTIREIRSANPLPDLL
jgi:hypothetical protein